VRVPDFAIQAAKAQLFSHAVCTNYAPVVTYDQREQWEKYAAGTGNGSTSDEIVVETLYIQENWAHYYGPIEENHNYTHANVIYGDFGNIPYNQSRPDRLDAFLPCWQSFPLIMTSYPPANYGKMTSSWRLTLSDEYNFHRRDPKL
jgi:hypothetical protein